MKKIGLFLIAMLFGCVGFLLVWFLWVQDVFTGVAIGAVVMISANVMLQARYSESSMFNKEVTEHLKGEKIVFFSTRDTKEKRLFSRDTSENLRILSVFAITDKRVYFKDKISGDEIDIPLEDIRGVDVSDVTLSITDVCRTSQFVINNGTMDVAIENLTSLLGIPKESTSQGTELSNMQQK